MTVRHWLASAAVSTGLGLGLLTPAMAAEPSKAEYTFGALRSATPEAAKAQSEAWLKKVGKFDADRFGTIWKDENATVLDRVLLTFEMGSDEAKGILSQARLAEKAAPKEVPAILKDEKQDSFFRANLALGFAKHLSNARVYEEALETLKLVKAESVVDPSSYLFHKAAAEFALIKKDDCSRTIVRLLDDVSDTPDRYRMLATIMYLDMASWKERGLGNIAQLMDNVERRLDQARGGKVTQDIQKKIVFRLDELIKEKENQKGGGA